jgi:hypothetical protein
VSLWVLWSNDAGYDVVVVYTKEGDMPNRAIIQTQLEFYRKGGAGCLFAAHAASDPKKFDWRLTISHVDAAQITAIAQEAIYEPHISTQSIIFPTVVQAEDLLKLLSVLSEALPFSLGMQEQFKRMMCLGFRVKVGDEQSWVAGFGNFRFLPKTRQAVFTEVVFRSKSRPKYDHVMKEAPPGTIHVADMDMKGMSENKFKSLWYGSFDRTEKLLGHKPDLRSAAKTTYAVPVRLWRQSR